ncbi:MAG: hypothetical protein ABR915_21790 [Thermoguttaceae bacterium]|jgi:hypothetical protein
MDNSRYGASPSLDEFVEAILDRPNSASAAAFAAAILCEQGFNPDEPRDEKGHWPWSELALS